MTEDEWNRCQDPEAMLVFLRDSRKASERKVRLFACSCCRRVWQLMPDDRCRQAVEFAEQFAAGLAHPRGRPAARKAAVAALRATTEDSERGLTGMPAVNAADAAHHTLARKAWVAAECASQAAANATGWARAPVPLGPGVSVTPPFRGRRDAERAEQCRLLRCIFPNPFRPPPPIPRTVLAWNDETVVKIATAIYDEHRWDEVGILADALEDAGCTDIQILEHLGGPGPHCRGCFGVDAILGRS